MVDDPNAHVTQSQITALRDAFNASFNRRPRIFKTKAGATGTYDQTTGTLTMPAVLVSDLSDATAIGKSILAAADATDARSKIGAMGAPTGTPAPGQVPTRQSDGSTAWATPPSATASAPAAADITDAGAVGEAVVRAADKPTARAAIDAASTGDVHNLKAGTGITFDVDPATGDITIGSTGGTTTTGETATVQLADYTY